MSTRCQIIIEGADVVLYRHSDGYPEGPHGVVKILKKIVMNFVKNRCFDECYLPAHIIADMIVAYKKGQDAMYRDAVKRGENPSKVSYDRGKYLGYGVEAYNAEADAAFHSDIEFLYVVKKNGTIEVRQCFTDSNGPTNIGNTKLVKTVKYGKK